ncbi:hypothetical protein Peur_030195 [Populus x canadensis]
MKCHRCLIGVEHITKITSKSHDKPKVSQSRDPSISLGPPGPGSIPQLFLAALSSWLVPQNEAVPSNLRLRPPCRLASNRGKSFALDLRDSKPSKQTNTRSKIKSFPSKFATNSSRTDTNPNRNHSLFMFLNELKKNLMVSARIGVGGGAV